MPSWAPSPFPTPGAPGGSATLNEFGVVPLSQIDDAIESGLKPQTGWNANTDTPELSGSTPDLGAYWWVEVAGTTDLDGYADWAVGDWAIYTVSGWQKKTQSVPAHSHVSAATGGTVEHDVLTGLDDDDHPGHPWGLGRAGGQTLTGGAATGEDLTLASTAHATKGAVKIAAGDNLDVSAASSLKLPTASGAAPTTAGAVAYDSTSETVRFGDGSAAQRLINIPASYVPADGDQIVYDTDVGGWRLVTNPGDGTIWGAATEGPAWLDAADLNLVETSDARLSDARAPTSHATSHQHGGTDQIATATPSANAIPKANSSGKLAAGWGGAASTLATLNSSTKVVEDPANATATPTTSKIPIADGSGKLDGWISAATTSVYGLTQLSSATPAALGAATAGASGKASDGAHVHAMPSAADVAAIPSAYLDTDGTLAANSDTKVPSQKAVVTYVAAAVTGLLDFKGSQNCSANPNYPAASKGDAYIVSVAGKIGGASGTTVEIGDVFFAIADNAGGTEASVGTSWDTLQHNLVGALLAANNLSDLGSASTARSNLALGTTAVLNLDTDGTLVANSDGVVPSQKAVKTYADAHVAGITVSGTPSAGMSLVATSPSAAAWTFLGVMVVLTASRLHLDTPLTGNQRFVSDNVNNSYAFVNVVIA